MELARVDVLDWFVTSFDIIKVIGFDADDHALDERVFLWGTEC